MTDTTHVAVIGLGAIGGSIALKLIECGSTPRGYTPDNADADAARGAGVRVMPTIEAAVQGQELIVLAMPLNVLATVADAVVASAAREATILHVASLQRPDAVRLSDVTRPRVIGTHPLAGTHGSGFRAAGGDLFRDATVYAESRSSDRMREEIERFWIMLGAGCVEYMDADEHDVLMARVSHLPQLVATALAVVLARRGIRLRDLGPGARDVTRLAASALSMWQPILDRAPSECHDLLSEMEQTLAELQAARLQPETVRLQELWEVAREWRTNAGP